MTISTGQAVLVLAVYVLAVARLTRLINGDRVLDAVRLYPARKLREAQVRHREGVMRGLVDQTKSAQRSVSRWDEVLYFVSCPWCVGMWIALVTAIVPVLVLGWAWWAFLPVALATSHLVGVCARFADTEEIEIEDGDETS